MAKAAVKNVVVIGASYAGSHAAELLAAGLPKTHRVILIDKNSHFNHVYRFVRFGVVPGHEAKAFIPYNNIFTKAQANAPLISEHHCPTSEGAGAGAAGDYARSVFIHANVVSLTKRYVEVDRTLCEADGLTDACVVEPDHQPVWCGAYTRAKADGSLEHAGFNCTCLNGAEGPPSGRGNSRTTKIRFDYLVFAAGSIMPRPLWSNSRTKAEGMRFLQDQQAVIAQARSVLVVGGGALGIQYATDIADQYPDKTVTLIHSRERLLPLFDPALHEGALARLRALGVRVILGDRVLLPEGHVLEGGELRHRVVRTQRGREIETDLQLFCTGQRPNTALLRHCMPTAVAKDGLVRVHHTMQIRAAGHSVPHMFAVGDCCDAFDAIKAGHTGWNQATVAAKNILRIVAAREAPPPPATENGSALINGHARPPLELEHYVPTKPMISLSLGLSQSMKQMVGPDGEIVVSENHDEDVDSHWQQMWSSLGVFSDDPFI